MRTLTTTVVLAMLTAACGGGQEQPTTEATSAPAPPASTASATPEADRALPMPSDAELHGAPRPNPEDLRELYDVSRDLQAVAAGETGADRDLADDLAKFVPDNADQARINALVQAMASALNGRTLEQPAANRLATQLYVVLHAEDMTQSQQNATSAELRQTLESVGVARAQADAVVAQMPRPGAR